jgi:hypothetical protein
MRIALLIVAALVAAIPAFAHSWYPLACCGNMDCFPVACDQLVETVSGWLYVPTGNLFRRAVALPVAGYDYNSDWTPLLAGLSPLRTHAGAGAAESKELRNKPSMS